MNKEMILKTTNVLYSAKLQLHSLLCSYRPGQIGVTETAIIIQNIEKHLEELKKLISDPKAEVCDATGGASSKTA
jgi:hypothetical protein